ncbi:MAG: GDP-mannose 4,6-dehydratase [Candidatus Thermoplasmatota archaeon]|jgi:GDPmannose 4,6-dehydratase|nr:GDP-mannose 4,6-dehydratase [Candidatus Thermoplasmatota archaeon]
MKAVITGISGQDGYFLSQLLFSKRYEVHGILRRNSSMTQGTVSRLPVDVKSNLIIHYGDITDSQFISTLVSKEKPDEFYHLAAQSFVGYSFQNAMSTYDANISGTLNVCNAIKDFSPDTRMYFAATSEMFGQPKETPQNEHTVLAPRSPYAVSKLAGFWTVKTYRDAYNLFMANGILFNHESEVRGPEFVTRKISQAVAKISFGSKDELVLGNLDAIKDWGYASDYTDAMFMILKQDIPDDFVIGTGESHTVREFVEVAFKEIGINITWKGKGINEVGLNDKGKTIVRVSKEFFRPLESDNYRADYTKAKTKLGWKPKIRFKDLVKIMVKEDLKLLDNHTT